MDMGKALKIYLHADSGLTGVISTRTYPERLPEGVTFPCMTYKLVTSPKVTTRDANEPADLAFSRYQFDCYGTDYEEALSVAKQLRLALDQYQGTMGGTAGVRVDGAFVETEMDAYEVAFEQYRRIVDVTLHHAEETS